MNTQLFNFLKLAGPTPSYRPQERLDQHFNTVGDGKKWTIFRRNLRSRKFVKAVQQDERSDDKLKQYAQMVHIHKTGKGPIFPVKSDTTGKTYTVKYHPDIDRFTCSCPDWTIKHSIDGGDCKHIKKLKSQTDMVKKASLAMRELFGMGRAGLQAYRNESNEQQAWRARQVNAIHRGLSRQRMGTKG